MLMQYSENDINREPKLLKKWLSEKTNESNESKKDKIVVKKDYNSNSNNSNSYSKKK